MGIFTTTTTRHRCRARRQSDQLCCHQCGLVWDVSDPSPPVCVIAPRRELGHVFTHTGTYWQVSALGPDFILATRRSVIGEPQSSGDLLRVVLAAAPTN